MAATSTWSWTLTLRVNNGYQEVIPGQSMTSASATSDTVLANILAELRNGELKGVTFSVADFSATRTS